jgi:V/A-type H+-transporting ATPase subunit A
MGHDKREGSITAIGAVSPSGGDMSDPVVQATLRTVKVYWELDASLAYKRHFPAINWLSSYSLYLDEIFAYIDTNIYDGWSGMLKTAQRILQEETELEEIVQLVGYDSLGAEDRLTLETARSIREDFLQQNGFHEIDTYTSLDKQARILESILNMHTAAGDALKAGFPIDGILKLNVRDKIARTKYEPEDGMKDYTKDTAMQMSAEFSALTEDAND